MPKIVFVMNIDTPYIEQVQKLASNWEVIAGRDETIWLPHIKEAEIICGWNQDVEREVLGAERSALRWIHNWGAGVDRFPFERLQAHHVMLTNSKGVHAYPISETLLGCMLALTRKIHQYVRNQTEHKWDHGNLSLEMHGKTVVLFGVGAIGEETAKLCKAFGMHVIGVRRSAKASPFVDQFCDFHLLKDILPTADYVVNTLPLTAGTRHLVNREMFARMKPSAFYFNIGRGETTVEVDLIDALRTKTIAGAGIDVFEQEPLAKESPLWELENVILTPHSSGSTEHYNQRVMDIFLPNLEMYLRSGEPRLNRVDLDLQY